MQRSAGKETFYAYDKFGRLTQQGEKTVQTETVYLQNFYDDHIAFRAALPNDIRDQYPNDTSDNAKGSLTGTIMNVFGSSEKIYTVYYYDIKGRVIKTIENNLMGGYNTKVTTYTFTDQPATVTLTHTANGKATQTEVYTYTYDHSDRISSVTHKLNSNAAVTLASYTYDNKGRMGTKKLHGSSSNQLTYAYNIRNWITGITSSKFTQTLSYGSYYNGNISSMNWTANGTSHSYAFTYDDVNRMLNATHGTGAYTEKITEYDKNGNIKYLYRYNNGSLVDNLTYIYSGNQLTKVEDATGNATGFTNGASQANEYTYDNNGNLTKDLNKGISNISYNSLSLPQVVTFSNGNTITYLYTADGKKLRTVHVTSGTATTTDYCGNVIYENGTQKLLLTEEGYINLNSPTTYYYYLKDHQGNNRVVINSSGTVQEVNHYYPFGSTFASSNVQPYKYNGKEQDTKNGLNWYDYGARHYDAVLGRWFVVDPLGEERYSNSVYSYASNSPINKIDPNGMLDDWVKNLETNEYVWMDNVTSIENTPDGYKYIGSSSEDILADLNLKTDFESKVMKNGGIGLTNDEAVRYGILPSGGYYSMKGHISVSANITQNRENVTSINSMGIIFEGISFKANVSYISAGTDSDFKPQPKGHFIVEYGDLLYSPLLLPKEAVVYEQGWTPLSATVDIPSKMISRDNYFSHATIALGVTNNNYLYFSSNKMKWSLMRNSLWIQK